MPGGWTLESDRTGGQLAIGAASGPIGLRAALPPEPPPLRRLTDRSLASGCRGAAWRSPAPRTPIAPGVQAASAATHCRSAGGRADGAHAGGRVGAASGGPAPRGSASRAAPPGRRPHANIPRLAPQQESRVCHRRASGGICTHCRHLRPELNRLGLRGTHSADRRRPQVLCVAAAAPLHSPANSSAPGAFHARPSAPQALARRQ